MYSVEIKSLAVGDATIYSNLSLSFLSRLDLDFHLNSTSVRITRTLLCELKRDRNDHGEQCHFDLFYDLLQPIIDRTEGKIKMNSRAYGCQARGPIRKHLPNTLGKRSFPDVITCIDLLLP